MLEDVPCGGKVGQNTCKMKSELKIIDEENKKPKGEKSYYTL